MVGWIFAGVQKLLANVVEVGDEVGDRRLGRHGSVLEGNSVGDDAVAENHGDFTALLSGHLPRGGEVGSVLDGDVLTVHVG